MEVVAEVTMKIMGAAPLTPPASFGAAAKSMANNEMDSWLDDDDDDDGAAESAKSGAASGSSASK